MTQSSVLAISLATAVLQELQPALTASAQVCLRLSTQISTLLVGFLSAPITPATAFDFENRLDLLLDEAGRLVVQTAFNHIEPDQSQDAPKHTQRDGQDYSRKNAKSPLRDGLATLFGRITLRRCLYAPLQEAHDDGQRGFSPLEICLGIVASNATPALAERVGRLSSQHSQQEMLDLLEHDHHFRWSVQVLRGVTAAVSVGIAPYLRAQQQAALLGWLEQAEQSRGRYRIVLAVGRDGILLPIRAEESYKEGAVATLSVYDRRGRRLGTVYLGAMPEALQVTLSEELTALVQGVLAAWTGALPRLVYLTDAGYHPTVYFKEVLQRMENPQRAGELLEWIWIVDYYHAASYVSQLARVLFHAEKTRHVWTRRMRQLLKEQDGGVLRVLASAAQYYGKKTWTKEAEKEYQEAYNYLLKHSQEMRYSAYRRVRLPIGSGVTEAGCKVVFTQRFKQSGMTWGRDGGEVILRLRLAVHSGVWEEVYREYLNHQPLVSLTTPRPISRPSEEKAA